MFTTVLNFNVNYFQIFSDWMINQITLKKDHRLFANFMAIAQSCPIFPSCFLGEQFWALTVCLTFISKSYKQIWVEFGRRIDPLLTAKLNVGFFSYLMIITGCEAALRCCWCKPDIWDFQVGSSLRLCMFAISKRPNNILMCKRLLSATFAFHPFLMPHLAQTLDKLTN